MPWPCSRPTGRFCMVGWSTGCSQCSRWCSNCGFFTVCSICVGDSENRTPFCAASALLMSESDPYKPPAPTAPPEQPEKPEPTGLRAFLGPISSLLTLLCLVVVLPQQSPTLVSVPLAFHVVTGGAVFMAYKACRIGGKWNLPFGMWALCAQAWHFSALSLLTYFSMRR